MSTDYPAQILNHDGSEIEMEGRINFTDPSNAPGGSQPVTRGEYSGNNVSVPNTGSPVELTLNTLVQGTALLDLAVTNRPAFVTAGVYAVTISTVPGSSMTDGKAYVLRLILNGDAADTLDTRQLVAVADSLDFDTASTLSATHYCEAGSYLAAAVAQADSGAINFALAAWVQRLS